MDQYFLPPCRLCVCLCAGVDDKNRAMTVSVKRDSVLVDPAVPLRALSPSALLFLPLTSHCCNGGVLSEPGHRPLWRTLSSLTSACPPLLCNQRSSQMSRWDKWDPFPPVMAPEMVWSASCFLPFNTQDCSSFVSYLILSFLELFRLLC